MFHVKHSIFNLIFFLFLLKSVSRETFYYTVVQINIAQDFNSKKSLDYKAVIVHDFGFLAIQ